MSKPDDPAYHWNSAELDLDAYLARIGFAGERAPTLATLRELVYRHTTAIPFENLEAVLGRPVRLDLASLQDKLVHSRRGGYCYENAGLFAAALERLGFGVTGHTGRVTMGAGGLRPATHALLRVTTADDDRVWMCDVGFGRGPLRPYELRPQPDEFTLGDWRFRLERRTGELGTDLWVLHQFGRDGWVDRYTFTTAPQYRIDFEVGNHFVSTSPRSPFTTRPFLQRFHPDRHHVLDGLTLTTERPDGSADIRALTPGELPEVMNELFDIELPGPDLDALTTGSWLERVAAGTP
ncbi:arylamine N-acetyltransferase family protein [Nocardia farcinica]|uniref:arylamine N-acetyltransferase family protein n=1 Tax=Nocardia farcinica TaxID=37329 RepID=UPI00245627DE|nr:arylamine N-acetyltransferase [Nocardia farcinica]